MDSCVFRADTWGKVQGLEHGSENYGVNDIEEKRIND